MQKDSYEHITQKIEATPHIAKMRGDFSRLQDMQGYLAAAWDEADNAITGEAKMSISLAYAQVTMAIRQQETALHEAHRDEFLRLRGNRI